MSLAFRKEVFVRMMALFAIIALTTGAAFAAGPGLDTGTLSTGEGRNFDARVAANRGHLSDPAATQRGAVSGLRASIPELAVTYDPATGVTRTLYNQTGYLTGPNAAGDDALTLGLGWLESHLDVLGLTAADLASYEVTDSVYTKVTGATHIYLRQTHRGLPVYNGQLHLNVNRDGRLISVNNGFVPRLASAVNATEPGIDAAEAVARAADHLGLKGEAPRALSPAVGAEQRTTLEAAGISTEPIEAQLMLLPIRRGEARLVWNFQVYTPDAQHAYDMTVDALTGKVWTRFDWVNSAQYRVYAQPAESPNHVTPLPPADGRSLVVNPQDATASPLGWHDTGSTSYQIHRGNNVHAYDDRDNNNAPPASEPSCGASLNCDFAIDLTQAPSQYIPAAVANLFYWNNIIHDVQYQYGFDEPGGNFQVNTFGNGGAGNDDVRAEAQDGSGTNNANFLTPTDGSRPRMQMYVWTAPNPDKDGDLDSSIVVHEYGHGISIRQVGGPGNSSCLNNTQQPGEGWSDWFALVYTAEVGDAGTDTRGIGTYALDQPTNGTGIRTQPYSTNPSVNTWTYATIGTGVSVPHGVGAVWAQGIWEGYWALVDTYGFDPDLYNPLGGAGNQRMLLYVNEGLKNTACGPTFLDARDGIIQAATDNYGGQDVCRLWEAFAAYGLGTDASTSGPNSTNATNGFSVPASCSCSPAPIADAGPDQTICLGDSATLGTPAQPSNSYSWSPGGQTTAQITVSPTTTTTYTVTATTSCGSANDSVTVTVDDGSGGGLSTDFEGGLGGWATSGLWHLTSNSSCASPGYSSPVNAVYYGQDSTCNYDTGGTNSGTLTSPTITGITSSSTLTFDYYRVVESFSGDYDRTSVEIVTSGGSTTVWSRNSSDASTAAWTSSGPISLSSFAGQSIQVRFRFETVDGVSNNFTGWFIDDVVVTGESACTPGNTAPTVTITAPADGSTFTEGDSVSFAGSASDAEDGDLTSGLSWSSNLDGTIGSGGSFSTSTLSVGTHTITASVTDSGGLPGSDSISITINPAGGDFINFNTTPLVAYSNQDTSNGTVTLEDGGFTVFMTGNRWRRTEQTWTITPNTVIEFEFQSTEEGEIHGIGFDENDTLTDATRIFQLYGTQNWTSAFHNYDNYSTPGVFQSYTIPVGQFYTGSGFRLVLVNDKDSGSFTNTSRFRNVRVYEDTPPPGCVTVNFESGASGWTNSGASTCSTGTFVVGTPTEVVNGGVTTQVGGDHTTGSGNAFFTATNSSAGVNDVDGGNCIAESGNTSVSEASDVSVWYFHGQRDTGGDPSGDFFLLEISTNGGSTWSTLASNGDVTSNAAWTEVTTTVPAGSTVRFRVQASDGPATGDLVEAGVDDIEICPSGSFDKPSR